MPKGYSFTVSTPNFQWGVYRKAVPGLIRDGKLVALFDEVSEAERVVNMDASMERLVAAARWLLDDLGDADETHSEAGEEFDSVKELREALEVVEGISAKE